MEGVPEFSDFQEPMPCYEVDPRLEPSGDDGRCAHCRKFLTVECEYVDDFLEEGE